MKKIKTIEFIACLAAWDLDPLTWEETKYIMNRLIEQPEWDVDQVATPTDIILEWASEI